MRCCGVETPRAKGGPIRAPRRDGTSVSLGLSATDDDPLTTDSGRPNHPRSRKFSKSLRPTFWLFSG